MSIRRINSTGRKKIRRENARIIVREDGGDGALTFDAILDLGEYDLPGDAHVFVEAYRQTTFMRFPHGTVSSPQPPHDEPRLLTEFATRDGLLFRVKVTSSDGRPGVLLAEADRIPISDDEEQPDNRVALLPAVPYDLGQETWRVDFNGAGGPQLLVNTRVGDWKTVARSPAFRSLVYPAAMRQILWHIYKVEECRDVDDPDAWQSRWLAFAATLPGVGLPPAGGEEDDWSDWIDGAVASFSRQHQLLDHYKTSIAEGNA